MLPADVERATRRYLALADRLLPGQVVGLYVVGSSALGDYVPGRSDVDVVVVLGGRGDVEPRRLRALHLGAGGAGAVAAAVRGRSPIRGTVNAVVVGEADLGRPVTSIVPVASHTGTRFRVGAGFDVNPVVWTVLRDRGMAVRGPAPASLGLDPEPERLVRWNLDNLRAYWLPWAAGLRRASPWAVAWGMLGPPRLHRTIVHGDVVSKPAAGEYAKDTFDPRYHPLLDDAVAYARRRRPSRRDHDPATVAAFVREVAADAAHRAR